MLCASSKMMKGCVLKRPLNQSMSSGMTEAAGLQRANHTPFSRCSKRRNCSIRCRSFMTERARRWSGSTAGWARSPSTLRRALPVQANFPHAPPHDPRRLQPEQSCGLLCAMA